MIPRLILKIKDPGATPQISSYEIYPGDTVRIGRGRRNNVVVRNPFVSREHVQLSWTEDGLILKDLSSTNGTWVNQQHVDHLSPIKAGDYVELSDVKILIINPNIMIAALQSKVFSPADELRSHLEDKVIVASVDALEKSADDLRDITAAAEPTHVRVRPKRRIEAFVREWGKFLVIVGGAASFILMI